MSQTMAPSHQRSRDVFRFYFSLFGFHVEVKNGRNEIVTTISQNLMVILTHPFFSFCLLLMRCDYVWGTHTHTSQLLHRYSAGARISIELCAR